MKIVFINSSEPVVQGMDECFYFSHEPVLSFKLDKNWSLFDYKQLSRAKTPKPIMINPEIRLIQIRGLVINLFAEQAETAA